MGRSGRPAALHQRRSTTIWFANPAGLCRLPHYGAPAHPFSKQAQNFLQVFV